MFHKSLSSSESLKD